MKRRPPIRAALLASAAVTAALSALCVGGCAGSLQADYVAADQVTHDAFAPVVARDVASGHQATQFAYDAWTQRLTKAQAAASQPSK